MNIKQHQIWKTNNGLFAWIVEVSEDVTSTYPYYGIICDEFADDMKNCSWTKEGYYHSEGGEHRYDLVELVR